MASSTASEVLTEVNSLLDFDVRTEFTTLLRGIRKGDWNAVKDFLGKYKNLIGEVIFPGGLTIMHVACIGGHWRIFKELVKIVSEDYLEIRDENGGTSFSLAATTGKLKIAECLVQKNDKLLIIPNHDGNIPLVVACANRQKDMTTYLYSITPFHFLLPENSNVPQIFCTQ